MFGRHFAGKSASALDIFAGSFRNAGRRTTKRRGPQRFRSQWMERLEQRVTLAADTFVTINTTYGAFQVELFNTATPQTVANFLHYINNNSYNNSIFHRSVPGFVLQGGGYNSSSTTFTNTSQFTAIATNGTVPSEAGIKNTTGTLAMALSTGPNSGTDQWYINLADNPMLDGTSNGGPFTVFGKVIGNGMQIVNQMAALPTQNQGGAFASLPVDAAHGNKLAEITSVVVDGGITGQVYRDLNSNGTVDNGEVGIPNQTVYIDANNNGVLDAGEVSVTTNSGGVYTFQALAPGAYVVREVVTTNHGLALTSPMGGFSTVTVVANTVVTGPNFGNLQVSTLTPLPISTTSPPLAADVNSAYIQAVFQSLLGHAADSAGLAYWQSQMTGGATRDAVARGVWNSPEHRGYEVDQYYQTFLGRAADASGRAYWINSFSSWGNERIVVASFVTSQEYQNQHSSNASYLAAIYTDLLARQADANGLAAWQASLQTGGKSRLDAAFAFIDGAEAHRQVVDGYFADFFERTGTTDRDNWVNQLNNKTTTIEDSGVAILASNEFFSRIVNSGVSH